MGFGVALAIGGSLIKAFSGRKAGQQSARDAKEASALEREKFARDKVAVLHDQAFSRGVNRVDAAVSGLDARSFEDVFESNEVVNQLDLENLRFNSREVQRGFERDRRNAKTASRSAVIGGIAEIGTTLIGTIDE